MSAEQITLWLKRKKLLFSYNLKRLRSKVLYPHVLLFFFCSFLYCVVIFPDIAGRVPFVRNWKWHKLYSIKGSVYFTSFDTERTKKDNILKTGNWSIEVGGYKSKIGTDGKFELEFASKAQKDIPLVVSNAESYFLYRISYKEDTRTIDTVLTINLTK